MMSVSDAGGGPDPSRARGMAKMKGVHGFSVDPDDILRPCVDSTVDHLFGEVWTRPGLDIRDRRLKTLEVLAALDQPRKLEIQFSSALDCGDLAEDQVREVVVHLSHHVGWPLSTGNDFVTERVIARRNRNERS